MTNKTIIRVDNRTFIIEHADGVTYFTVQVTGQPGLMTALKPEQGREIAKALQGKPTR